MYAPFEQIPVAINVSPGSLSLPSPNDGNIATRNQANRHKSKAHPRAKNKRSTALKKTKMDRRDSKILSDFEDPNYTESDESEDNRRSGLKMHPLLLQISKPCRKRNESATGSSESKKYVRCIGSKWCGKFWVWKRNKQRILDHANKCRYIPADLRREVLEELAAQDVAPPLHIRKEDADWISNDDDPNNSTQRPSKRPRVDLGHAATGNKGAGAAFKIGKQSALPTNTTATSLDGYVKQGLQDKADHALTVMITCNGIPPNVVKSRSFKNFVSVLNAKYSPPSRSTLSERLIPSHAANICSAVIEFLSTQRDVTISFDGGQTRGRTGLYSVHVTTADRQTFCIALNDGSRLSHSADYIIEVINNVSEAKQYYIQYCN